MWFFSSTKVLLVRNWFYWVDTKTFLSTFFTDGSEINTMIHRRGGRMLLGGTKGALFFAVYILDSLHQFFRVTLSMNFFLLDYTRQDLGLWFDPCACSVDIKKKGLTKMGVWGCWNTLRNRLESEIAQSSRDSKKHTIFGTDCICVGGCFILHARVMYFYTRTSCFIRGMTGRDNIGSLLLLDNLLRYFLLRGSENQVEVCTLSFFWGVSNLSWAIF